VVCGRGARLRLKEGVVEDVQRDDAEACGGDLRLGLRADTRSRSPLRSATSSAATPIARASHDPLVTFNGAGR
jgi:hypothetical protein